MFCVRSLIKFHSLVYENNIYEYTSVVLMITVLKSSLPTPFSFSPFLSCTPPSNRMQL